MEFSRRSLLIAGVASAASVAGAGAFAAQPSRTRRWLHSAGVLDGPDLAIPDGGARVGYEELESASMKRNVRWGLALPEGDPKALVLCMHGRGATASFAFDDIGVHQFVRQRGSHWAVAAADGGSSSYWHRRRDGSDPQQMIFDELLPEILRRIGEVPVVLLGWSMGGYGALLGASRRPHQVNAVAVAAPALFRSFNSAARGAFDNARDFAEHDVFRALPTLREVHVRIDCGEDDPFAPMVRKLADQLPDAQAEFGAGFHDAATWRHRLPNQLRFFERSLSDASVTGSSATGSAP